MNFDIKSLNAETVVALDEKLKKNRPLVVKLGFDPTSPDLHLGHFVVLRGLRKFQDAGHKAHIIVGDFTAAIGDPSGRNKLRPPLDKEQIAENAKTYLDQVFMVLDNDKSLVSSNSGWLNMNMEEILRIMSTQTIAKIMAREDFNKRFSEGTPIFMHEMLYPMMQGMDSVAIKADVELGGTDQTFNLMMGRDMQDVHKQEPQAVVTFPLLVGLDGEKKMSKSLGNHIALMDTPKDIFGKIMSLSDKTMWNYWKVLCDESDEEITKMQESGDNPRNIKLKLATKIVAMLHPQNVADKECLAFVEQFSKKSLDLDAVETQNVEVGTGIVLTKVIQHVGFAKSGGDASRLVQGGGVKINGEKVADPKQVVLPGIEFLLQVGKLHHKKIKTF